MNAVYILISNKDQNRYIGSTNDINRRIWEHNKGLVPSTKRRRPLKLYAIQKCPSIEIARQIESEYKKSRGRFQKALKSGALKIVEKSKG